MDALAALQASETFEGLPAEDLAALVRFARECTFEPGTTIFSEGQPAHDLYLVVTGRVALEKDIVLDRRGAARRATVDVIGRGGVFGWSALVEPRRLTASAVCVEQTLALGFPHAEVEAFLKQHPATGYELMRRLAGVAALRLRDTTARLSYLLSAAAHDLRAPLTAMDSYVEALLGGYAGPLGDKQRQTLVSCRERLGEAQEMVGNYLELSRLEAGQAMDQMVPLSLAEVARRAVNVMQPAARDKSVELVARLPEDLPPIKGLPLRLRQVVVNLLSNAVKFTPRGGRAEVVLVALDDEVELSVSDTGVGIAPVNLSRVFDDFFRNGEAEGAGLGLAVARRIIVAHGGRIWAESPLNPEATDAKGSRFVVTLPLLEPDELSRQE
ncbi:MAG: ATP-binding protein [Chloroflexi bacterium]|nr:ATP-binding protein [Chloroflexota bacterium]